MARPKRHNADYFSHDAGMRNDPKVKALRNKFGNDGYAVWGMMLEVLTASDYFTRSIDEIEIEILSADFGIEPELFSEILSYMVRLRLLQTGDNCEYLSQKLSDRMQSVVDKRRNSKPKGVSVTESTQSKVKESKVKKTKEIEERKKEFKDLAKNKWIELGGEKYLCEKEAIKFCNYWTEHGPTDRKMRFEKENAFGMGRRLGTWKERNTKPINPNVRQGGRI
tara:strand:+ start:167 stop:835 length:669 start_codon:yes stop_codon:yes gene_type:complete